MLLKSIRVATIQFFYQNVSFHFEHRNAVKSFILKLFKREKTGIESLNYIFCTDEALLEINRTYLNHDYYTDIITFNLNEPGSPVMGDIYISIDRVKDNAQVQGESFKRELHRVLFHGALHLCGYKDKRPAEEALMRKKEEAYLNDYF